MVFSFTKNTYTRLQFSQPLPRVQSLLELVLAQFRRRNVLLILAVVTLVSIGLGGTHVYRSTYSIDQWEYGDECLFVSPTESYWEGMERIGKKNGFGSRLGIKHLFGSGTTIKKRSSSRNTKFVDDLSDRLSRRKLSTDVQQQRQQRRAEWEDEDPEEDESFTASMKQKHGRLGHYYSPSGHVVVNQNNESAHPIPELLSLGEKRWADLIVAQSMDFSQAKAEYSKRLRKPPPKGFDHWWDFAVNASVVLIDEYDTLYTTLLPFYALPSEEVRKRAKEVEAYPETFVIDIKGGKATLELKDGWQEKWPGTQERGEDQLDLVKDFAQYLPDMRATFSLHDSPQLYLPFDTKHHLLRLGWEGKISDLREEPIHGTIDYKSSCPAESPMVTGEHLDDPNAPSFIFNQHEAEDVCLNPHLVSIHGTFIEEKTMDSHPKPHTRLLPILGHAKTSINSDIPITPLTQWNHFKEFDPRWAKKKDSRLVWRGATTGLQFSKETKWRSSHRPRLYHLTNTNSTEAITIMAPDLDFKDSVLKMKNVTLERKNMTEFYFDVKLTGHPIQCGDGSDGTCDEMKEEFQFSDFIGYAAANRYRYQLDVDGNSWSARFRRLLSTNSLIFKSTIYPEWYSKGLIPWFMYVPVQVNYKDLANSLAFFRGTPEVEDGFDEVAQAIARNGMCFTRRLWRKVDMQAYMFRMYLELARVLAEDRDSMNYE